MAKTVEINGTVYEIPKMDFNAIADLGERGVDVARFQEVTKEKGTASIVRAITAWIIGCDPREAGDEIQKHFDKHGTYPAVADAFMEVVNDEVFTKQGEKAERTPAKVPQDHKRKSTKTEE